MITTFKEKQRTVKFIVTDEDITLIQVKYFRTNEQGQSYCETQLLTTFQDYDVNDLIEEYKEHGILPMLISESIEQEIQATELK